MVANYDLEYFSNKDCKHYRFITLSKFFNNKLKKSVQHQFNSTYGSTSHISPESPSECGNFWYRWIKRGQHYVNSKNLSLFSLFFMKLTIRSIINISKKNLVVKNLANGQRIDVLNKIFPEAYYIVIKRDIYDNILSIKKAREHLKINPNELWSIKPKIYKDLLSYEISNQIYTQINRIYNQIHDDLVRFGLNYIELSYYEINHNLDESLRKIESFIQHTSTNKQISYDHVYSTYINSDEYIKLKAQLKGYDDE